MAASAVSQTNLAGAWSLDGVLTDASGNGRTLTMTGTIAYTAQGSQFRTGAKFDANASNYLNRNTTDDAVFDFGAGEFTLSLWVNFSVGTTGEMVLMEKFVATSGPGWTLYRKTGALPITFEFFCDMASDLTLTGAAAHQPIGKPHHVAVRRSVNTWTLWVNGVQNVSASNSGTIADTTADLQFGQRAGGTSLLNGTLSDVAIWTRALTDAEILTLWNNGLGEPAAYYLARRPA